MANVNTILVTGFAGRRHEDVSGSDNVQPGCFVRVNGTAVDGSGRNTVVLMDAAGGDYETRIVLEDSLSGGTTTDGDFDTGAPLQTYTPTPGEVVMGRLTTNVSYDEGDRLIFSNDGSLKKHTSTPDKVVATVKEAIDLTGLSGNRLGKVTIA